jgi:hypothetical protein
MVYPGCEEDMVAKMKQKAKGKTDKARKNKDKKQMR